ncbi:hypothetical protein [Primorskyibacter flagellatus]|uniref:hypothetical protein n=1 Tax=Primorskyibacter flagellatus TaxID=1387277 RepID=UPI003A8EDD05
MVNYVALAAVGFALFIFLVLLLLGAETKKRTSHESSLLQWRREIADRFGWGSQEKIQQHPYALEIQVWVLRAATLAAFCFTCWHTANAEFQG